MKIYQFKKSVRISLFTLVQILSTSFAFGGSSYLGRETFLDRCHPMSKDPRCWEQKSCDPKVDPRCWKPRPVICPVNYKCVKIAKVERDKWNFFTCTSGQGLQFSCKEIVETKGENIIGVIVKVTIPYHDPCHVPGACGRKCTPGFGSASLDKYCNSAVD